MSSQLLFVEMQKEKRSFVKLSALSLPSLQGDIRKTRKTIFSPMRVRKSGQEIGLLLKVAAPLTAIQKTNVIPPFKPFVSTRLFSKYPDTLGGARLCSEKRLSPRSGEQLLLTPSTGGQAGCYSHKHRLYSHGWNQQEQLKV